MFRFVLIACAIATSSFAHAAIQSNQKELSVNFSSIYVDKSADPGETVMVLTSGFYPNACYAWERSQVTHPDAFTHEVRGFAAVTQDICTMQIVPFQQNIKIGQLQPGVHKIKVINGDGTSFIKEVTVD